MFFALQFFKAPFETEVNKKIACIYSGRKTTIPYLDSMFGRRIHFNI